VLDMSTFGEAADVNPIIKFLPYTVNNVHRGHVHTCPLCHVIYRVWQELDYRIDICRFTKSRHIEHL
jgi:hypothetical protein